jgi:hypothetical protein
VGQHSVGHTIGNASGHAAPALTRGIPALQGVIETGPLLIPPATVRAPLGVDDAPPQPARRIAMHAIREYIVRKYPVG